MNYYIGDLHFGCTNKYENRTLETDKLIIKNWNKIIHQNDDVYLIGDIGRFGGSKDNEYLCQCLSVLKGRKHWVLGNHDNTKDARINQLFVELCDYKEITDNYNGLNHNLVLCHYPIMLWNGMHKGWIHLHGHTHLTDEQEFYEGCIERLNDFFADKTLKGYTDCPDARAFNVGCMIYDYKPVTLKEILENNKEETAIV